VPTGKKWTLRNQVVHDAVQRLIEFHISELQEYCDEVERYFAQQQKQVFERYKKQIAKHLDLDPDGDIAEFYGEERSRIELIFLTTLRYSLVVMTHSLLEVTLEDLCQHFQRSRNLRTTIDDLPGEGIDRAKRYLSQECKIDFSETTQEWQTIGRSAKVRNCITHCQGNVKKVRGQKKQQALMNIIKTMKRKGLTLDAAERSIRIDKSYVPSLIRCCDICIHTVLKQW
jgi:hypothetical protein